MSSVVARSVTAPVGTPPDQKNASIEPSRIAWTDSPTPSPRLAMSSSGSRPATSSRRSAITSVPEPGEPTETVLSRRSSSFSMPESALTTTCVMFGYSVASARTFSGSLERLVALHRVDRAVGERERDVGVAVRDEQQVVDRSRGRLGRGRRVGQLVAQQIGEPAAVDLVDAAGAAGGDRQAVAPARRVVGRAAEAEASPGPPHPPAASPCPFRARPSAERNGYPAACSSSRLRFSASCSAPVISSSSPASTASRLWTVRPSTRWSVTRRCGKL